MILKMDFCHGHFSQNKFENGFFVTIISLKINLKIYFYHDDFSQNNFFVMIISLKNKFENGFFVMVISPKINLKMDFLS